MPHFWTQEGPFAPNNFFWKIINIIINVIVQISKKSFQQIQIYEDVQFLSIKWLICTNENFFRKPVNEPCFFHSCLSTCQKSKSDISLLMKLEPDFSQACSFCRMLMNHKNFRFTQIPDKTNDMIFLKNLKTLFLGHF